MDKLIKQLKRDFKKNPKKVVLLGALCAVCLWVVVPLFLPKDKTPVTKNVAAPLAAESAAATSSTPAPTWRWQDLKRAFDLDPRMRSVDGASQAGDTAASRNPFETEFDLDAAMDELLEEIAAEIESERQTEALVAAPARDLFEKLPLALSGTLVGVDSRTAVINGRTFRIGDKIGRSFGVDVVLKEVEAGSAVVEWNGVRRELKLPRPMLQPAAQILAGARTGP